MNASTLSLLLVAAYLAALKFVAYKSHQSNKNTSSDFFITGRSTSSLLLVGTIIATMINTLAVTGVPALVYKGGILYSQMFAIGIIAPTLIAIFGPKIWNYGKRHELMTQGELFGHHFNSRTVTVFCALIGLIAMFPFMTIQLSAVGKVLSSVTGGTVGYELAVILTAVSIAAYLYFGGSRAVVWTDAIQGICFLLVIIASAVLFTVWSGGYTQGLERLSATIPEKLTLNDKNSYQLLDNVLSWPFAFFLWPQLFQRMFMAQSAGAIKRSVKWNFFFFNLVVLCTMTMGIMATGLMHGNIADPDQLVAQTFKTYFPIGGAFIVIAVFATGMSTVDSILLTSSSVISRDVLARSSKSSSEKRQFQEARYIALALLALSSSFALTETGRGAIGPLVTLGASFATLFLWPLLSTFYLKQLSYRPAICAMSLGFTSIILSAFSNLMNFAPFGAGTWGFITAAITFTLLAAAERKAPKQ